MTEIITQLNDPIGWLVLMGGALQAGACLFKSQIVLRVMLLAGTMHYLAYYFAVSTAPLWPAIVATTAIAMGNIIGTGRVLQARRRATRQADGPVSAAQDTTVTPFPRAA